MDDSARMWITTVPARDPDGGGPAVLLGHDCASRDTGERLVSLLLDRGHEGEEGVFYLLPFDLSARYERTGDRLAVVVTASRQILVKELADRADSSYGDLADLPGDGADDDRVILLRREMVTDFVPAEQDGAKQPVLLIDHDGSAASLAELFDRFEEGEAGIAVLNAE